MFYLNFSCRYHYYNVTIGNIFCRKFHFLYKSLANQFELYNWKFWCKKFVYLDDYTFLLPPKLVLSFKNFCFFLFVIFSFGGHICSPIQNSKTEIKKSRTFLLWPPPSLPPSLFHALLLCISLFLPLLVTDLCNFN